MYDYFGMTLTADTEREMQHYLDNDPKTTSYGKHKYTLEQFGLTKEDIRREFQEYIEIMTRRGVKQDMIL